MIRTGDRYRDSLSDGREIHIDGERVADGRKPSSEAAE